MKKQELPPRDFSGKRRWKIWVSTEHQMVRLCQPCFWDDLSLTPVDKIHIRWYCGVEIHSKVLVIALYGIYGDRNIFGPIERFDNTTLGQKQLHQFVESFHPCRFLMETTGVYHIPVAWFLQRSFPTSQVMVMDAFLISKLLDRTRKSDPIDASRIAQIARYDELLKPSYIPDLHMATVRDYTRQRIKAVAQVTRLKNRIKKLLALYGCGWDLDFQVKWQCDFLRAFLASTGSIEAFYQSPAGENWRSKVQMEADLQLWIDFDPPQEARHLLFFLFQRLALAQCDLQAVEYQIQIVFRSEVELNRQAHLIIDAPGMGEFGALEFISEIGDTERFSSAGSLLVYAGIAPKGGTSGVKVIGERDEKVVEQDHPNPRCNRRLKFILVNAAKIIARMANNGTKIHDDLIVYAKKVLKLKIKYYKKLFKIAAKLGRCLYTCLKNNTFYQSKLKIIAKPPISPRISQRKKISKKKAILQARLAEVWGNAEKLFDQLRMMSIPAEQVQDLMLLLYTGKEQDELNTSLGGEIE